MIVTMLHNQSKCIFSFLQLFETGDNKTIINGDAIGERDQGIL